MCKKVFVIHRRDKFRAEKNTTRKVNEKKNIEILWNQEVEKVIGDKEKRCILGIEIFNNKKNTKKELKLDGFFVAIGHSPATDLFKTKLKMDGEGYIITSPDSTKTNIEGVFAAGDVTDKIYRQAVTAAGMGCMSAIEAESFLNFKKDHLILIPFTISSFISNFIFSDLPNLTIDPDNQSNSSFFS